MDIDNGILNIRYSKGHDQHFIVLHDTMLELMRKYDAVISGTYPNRTYFFPARKDKYHTREWVQENFRDLWDKENTSYATAYELRHHYATENINHWTGEGMDFHAKLLYLSKSMGHSVIESTKYYYSLVPGLADILKEKTNDSFNNIIPEVNQNEKIE
jgi:integrase